MRSHYYIGDEEAKAQAKTVADRLALISKQMDSAASRELATAKVTGRRVLTRMLDAGLVLVRNYALPIHWLGVTLTATALFLYVRLVALTARLVTLGDRRWPDIPGPCVLALWHRDAPSLLVAFTVCRPRMRCLIMIARDPRGDCLALLCRMLGLQVVRGGSEAGGWTALSELADALVEGACAIITVDGGGPARVAKVGAVALASASSVPLVPLAADSRPAIPEPHKWDSARNPLPFSSVLVSLGTAQRFPHFRNLSAIEQAREGLEETLNEAAFELTNFGGR